jgi:ferritin-like metal-binding protein YciE
MLRLYLGVAARVLGHAGCWPPSLPFLIVRYLTDAHPIEQQAIAQTTAAPETAGDPLIASEFSDQLTETEDHERLVAERLETHAAGRRRSRISSGSLTGRGFGA